MLANNSKALRLLLCITGLLNESSIINVDVAGNSTMYDGRQRPMLLQLVSNSTDTHIWNAHDDGTKWLREFIKAKLVPTVCVFGIVGNLLTLVVLTYEHVRSEASVERKVNVWLQSLAVSDLLLCVVLLPHGLMTYGGHIIYTSLSFQLLYRAYGSAVINNFMLTSTWLTVAMSFGRYMAVCHPLGVCQNIALLEDCTARGDVSGKTRCKAGVIFIACFLFNLPRFFEYHIDSHRCGVEPDGSEQVVFVFSFGRYSNTLQTVYVWAYFAVAIVVPLMTLAFCNVRLVNKLHQSRQFRRIAQHVAMDELNTVGSGVTMVLIAVVLMYVVLVAPGEILTFISQHLLARCEQYRYLIVYTVLLLVAVWRSW